MNEYKAYRKIEIGHKKLSERVEKTLEQLSSNPTASISRACGDPHQAKAVMWFGLIFPLLNQLATFINNY